MNLVETVEYPLLASMSAKFGDLKSVAAAAIDQRKQELFELSDQIWRNPELNFQEHNAHRVLTDYLEGQGFVVKRGYTGIGTAFRASYGSGRPNVCVICEYDALPGIGHACGHNLIAEAGVAAGVGLKAAMESSGRVLGRLTVLGTPAEEGGGGKVFLIENGAFHDVDVAMMVHPSPTNNMRGYVAMSQLEVTYTGKAAHAASFPWEGVNALDAAVMGYSAVSMARQQFRPTWRVHGVITDGGLKPNIIPESSTLLYYIRAPTNEELQELKGKVVPCFEAAAKATGCQVAIKQVGKEYSNLKINPILAKKYMDNFKSLCGEDLQTGEPAASTDMGNVSYVVPSIHPKFAIGSGKEINHNSAFTAVANQPAAHSSALTAAKALAFTCIDVLTTEGELQRVVDSFNGKFLDA